MIRILLSIIGLVALGVLTGTLTAVIAYLASEDGIPTEERIQTGATVFGGLIALVGLGGVWVTLDRNARQQRVQTGPFVRVDLGTNGAEDFQPPKTHHHNTDEIEDLAGELEGIELSAWFQNLQAQPLGFALGVRAAFLLEMRLGQEVAVFRYREVNIAYVQHEKAVQVDIFRVPKSAAGQVNLISLSFYDLYEKRHEHWLDGRGGNGIYGRFLCRFQPGRVECLPQAWPRGPRVDWVTTVPDIR